MQFMEEWMEHFSSIDLSLPFPPDDGSSFGLTQIVKPQASMDKTIV